MHPELCIMSNASDILHSETFSFLVLIHKEFNTLDKKMMEDATTSAIVPFLQNPCAPFRPAPLKSNGKESHDMTKKVGVRC
jgi:hypothetical protein